MRFLFDVGVRRAAEAAAAAAGNDVASMLDTNPDAADLSILDRAVAEDRVLVTVDIGFGERVARRHLGHRGVTVLRLEGARSAEKAAAIAWIIATAGDRLYRHLAVFHNGRLRTGHPWDGD